MKTHKQLGFFCAAGDKIPLLLQILVQNSPKRGIVFCNSSASVAFVNRHLQSLGVAKNSPRVVVHSDATFNSAKGERGDAKMTAGHGFDCVINFDLPYAPRVYGERLRAVDAGGACISLLCDYYSDFAQPILDAYPLSCSWSPYVDQLPSRKQIKAWSTVAQPSNQSIATQKRTRVQRNGASSKSRQSREEQHAATPKRPSAQISIWSKIASLFNSKS
ncbi:MAG: hypothetical protein OYH77_02245 [Pseudomonadota bacterium]|nr:hypothetical protein [Pseudomonadota bacterium]